MAEPIDDIPYQSLYRRFRPASFAEVRGQDHVVLALRNAVRDSRVAHAYLFSGPRGTGKTSTARILAKALNCTDLHEGEPCGVCASCVEITKGTSLDVHELDAASNNGVEAMRDLVARAALGSPGRQKVYIVDEVHMLSTAASNTLLKTLEEPPAHVVFVLATTDPQKVLPTIRSRTQHYEFRLLGPETLAGLLDEVRTAAGLTVGDAALDVAVRRGRGSARDALSILDQVVASDVVDDDLPQLDEVVEALAERDVERALVAVAALTDAGFSPQQLTADLIDHLRQGFLAMVAPSLVTVAGAERAGLDEQANRVGLAALVRAMEELGRAQVSMRDAPDPRVNLEVALVRLAHPEADDSPAALLARIERLESVGPVGAPLAAVPKAASPVEPTIGPPASTAQPGPPQEARATSGPAQARAALTESMPVSTPVDNPSTESPAPVASRPTLGALRRGATGGVPTTDSPSALSPEGSESVRAPSALPGEPPSLSDVPSPSLHLVPDPPSLADLEQAWNDHVISRLRPKARALFLAGHFVGAGADGASFGLPNQTHRDRCEETRSEVEVALAEHFGRPVPLVLVVADGSGSVPISPVTPDPVVGGPSVGEDPPTPSSEGLRVARAAAAGPAAESAVDEEDEVQDLSVFDDEGLVAADLDNSPEARIREVFPGAEEVN